ncbi:MAG: cell division protein FtsZ [Dehalococcoidia bacterium]
MANREYVQSPAKIKVIGLGGGGCNAVSRMVREGIQGADFVAVNTDAQALKLAEAPTKLQIGDKLTRGLGVGGDPEKGLQAALESQDQLAKTIKGSDMVFLAAGMGGGTGTGSIPVIADMAKTSGALTVAMVTKPFSFEGAHRGLVAEEGLERLADKVDTLIIIPNDRLLSLCDQKAGVDQAFSFADDVLRRGVQAIVELINVPGVINVDFADVQTIMKDAGTAWMSIGAGKGQYRAVEAAKSALASPLLDVSVAGATGVLFIISGDASLTLHEVNEAAQVISKAVDSRANIIFGVIRDSQGEEEIRITLIATGFLSGLAAGMPKEVRELLRPELAEEGKLDIPTFLRHAPYRKRRWQDLESGPPDSPDTERTDPQM